MKLVADTRLKQPVLSKCPIVSVKASGGNVTHLHITMNDLASNIVNS